MGSWNAFYINHPHLWEVIEKLKDLSGIDQVKIGPYPQNWTERYLLDTNALPNLLAVAQSQPEWITVVHNSFHSMSTWAYILSEDFSSQVIVTSFQTTSSYYYFSVYEKGPIIREIEVCYGEDFESVDFGEKFPFETEKDPIINPQLLLKYCKALGLHPQNNPKEEIWHVLDNNEKNTSITISKAVSKLLKSKRKWW